MQSGWKTYNTRKQIIVIALSCLVVVQLVGCSLFDDDDDGTNWPNRSELIGNWTEKEFYLEESPADEESKIGLFQLNGDGSGAIGSGTPAENPDSVLFQWMYNPPTLSIIFGPEIIIEWISTVSIKDGNLHLIYVSGEQQRVLILERVE